MQIQAGPLDQAVGGYLYSDVLGYIRYGDFSYRLKLEAGIYQVGFSFRDPSVSVTGGRIFSIRANGQTLIDHLDIWGRAGGPVLHYGVLLTTGVDLSLDFITHTRSAIVSGIVLTPAKVLDLSYFNGLLQTQDESTTIPTLVF
jgi:hypothetical protein